jgi:hypothetical protein
MDIKTTQLGHEFTQAQLRNQSRAVYGGVAWPGKRSGFVVVLAIVYSDERKLWEIYLLDEFESPYMRELIRQCGLLHSKYEPYSWVGDTKNSSAEERMYEMKDDSGFSLNETDVIEKVPFYQYVVDELKDLRDEEHRRLFLKNSKVLNYMAEIEQGQVAELKRGEYPPLEALVYAAVEGLRTAESLSAGPYPATTGEVVSSDSSDRDLGYSGAIDTWNPNANDDYEEWAETTG